MSVHMVESNKINEMRMECPVCLDIMRYRGKKVKRLMELRAEYLGRKL